MKHRLCIQLPSHVTIDVLNSVESSTIISYNKTVCVVSRKKQSCWYTGSPDLEVVRLTAVSFVFGLLIARFGGSYMHLRIENT